jgi:hypothetical protein
MRRSGLVGIFAGLLIALSPTYSIANSITATSPIAGRTLDVAPSVITITTTAPLSDQGSQIVVNNPNGLAVDDASLTINANSATVGLQAITVTGVYTVNYTLLSNSSDPLTGSYTFIYNSPASIGTPTSVPSSVPTSHVSANLNGGSNAFVYTLLALALFVLLFLIWYARQSFGGKKKPVVKKTMPKSR